MKRWGAHAIYIGIILIGVIVVVGLSGRNSNTSDNLERAEAGIQTASEIRRELEYELSIATERNAELEGYLTVAEKRNTELTKYAGNLERIIDESGAELTGLTESIDHIGELIETGDAYNAER